MHAVGLPFLRAVDAAEADALSMVSVQDFNGVAVEDGDNRAGVVGMDVWNKDYEENQAEKMERNCSQLECLTMTQADLTTRSFLHARKCP